MAIRAHVETDPPRALAFVVDGQPPDDVTLTLLEPAGPLRVVRIFVLEDRNTVGRLEFDPPLEVPGLLGDKIVVSFPRKLHLPRPF